MAEEETKKLAENLQESDKMALELAKFRKQLTLAQAENADLSYRYIVLQLYMKYGLTEADTIDESGKILYDGALQQK